MRMFSGTEEEENLFGMRLLTDVLRRHYIKLTLWLLYNNIPKVVDTENVVIFSLLGNVQSHWYRRLFSATRTENCAGGELTYHPDWSRGTQQSK